jgi:hypothetical protein
MVQWKHNANKDKSRKVFWKYNVFELGSNYLSIDAHLMADATQYVHLLNGSLYLQAVVTCRLEISLFIINQAGKHEACASG